MKRIFNWQVYLGLLLVSLSVFIYFIHYLIFRDVHHIFIYLLGDVAFVFFEVLLVTMVLHQLLHYREKKALFKKLNMVIGAFFNEVGTELLGFITSFDPDVSKITNKIVVTNDWSKKDFAKTSKDLKAHDYSVDIKRASMEDLKTFLVKRRQFLLNLIENPSLLENESFTNLLLAIFHLTEELVHRKDLKSLSQIDYQHLAGDIERAYRSLILEWLAYMEHLKNNYPYLFSLAMRTNPFDKMASVEIK